MCLSSQYKKILIKEKTAHRLIKVLCLKVCHTLQPLKNFLGLLQAFSSFCSAILMLYLLPFQEDNVCKLFLAILCLSLTRQNWPFLKMHLDIPAKCMELHAQMQEHPLHSGGVLL